MKAIPLQCRVFIKYECLTTVFLARMGLTDENRQAGRVFWGWYEVGGCLG